MHKSSSLYLLLIVLLAISCNPVNTSQRQEVANTFTKGNVAYYADARNVGANVLSLDIYTSGLGLDSIGTSYVGVGKNLFFDDIFIPSAEHRLASGVYVSDSTGAPFTFISGKNNDGISSGARLISVSGMQISAENLTIGQFEVQNEGDSVFIDFELKTEKGLTFKAQFAGMMAWVDMVPELCKGRQVSRGRYYTNNAHNYLVQLGSLGIGFDTANSYGAGLELLLDFNTDTTSLNGIEAGRYIVAPFPEELSSFELFTKNTITPYFTLQQNGSQYDMGSWYTSYIELVSTIIQDGYADVRFDNDTCTIAYSFNVGSAYEISGEYVGALPLVQQASDKLCKTKSAESDLSHDIPFRFASK